MPRDLDGARIEDGEIATTRKWTTAPLVPTVQALQVAEATSRNRSAPAPRPADPMVEPKDVH